MEIELQVIHNLCQRIFYTLDKVDNTNLDKESKICLEKAKVINVNITRKIARKIEQNN